MIRKSHYPLWRAALAPAMGALGMLSGCATITGSETQNLSLQAVDASGNSVPEAECKLSNDKGTWRAKPPAIAVVNRSAEDLLVQCEAERQAPGVLRAVSRANAGMVGNIIFGGVVGAVIDHSKGTAYDYPSMLKVIFGSSRVVDRTDDRGDAPSLPATGVPAPSAQVQPLPTPVARIEPETPVRGTPASPTLPDVGNTYRYAWNERQYSRRQEFTVKIVGVQGWSVSESITIAGIPETTAAVNARELDFIGRRLAEGQSLLEFAPYLAVQSAGDAPALPQVLNYPAGGMEPWTVSARSPDWDQVTVPAGSYRALRLEIRGTRRTYTTAIARIGIAEKFEFTAWYAPDLKRYVKLRHRQWGGFNNELGDEQVELLAYRKD